MTVTLEPDLEPDEDELGDGEWEAPAELVDVDPLVPVATLPEHAEIVVSAFAGIGGLDVGFERAGFTTGVQIEWDAAATRVLAARFPHAAHFGDVRTVDGDAVRHALGGRRCRVLVGGFPCQDLSVAGSRAGMAGARSGLYGELLRLAAQLDPDWLVVENVPGLLSADADPEANDGDGYGAGSGFALFLGDLTGYYGAVPAGGWRNSGVCHGPLGTCAWRVLDAKNFGVAQRRRRVLVVFCPRDRVAPAAVLLEPEGVRRDPASRVPSWARAAGAAVDPALHGRGAAAEPAGAGPAGSPNGVEQVSALTSSLGKGGPDAAHALAGWMTPADELTTVVKSGHLDWREGEVSGPLAARDFKGRPGETAVAYGVAMRGRAEGNVPEVTAEEVSALRAASGGSTRDLVVPPEATPIQDGRDMTKAQNGLGVGEPGDPAYTLDTTGAQAVCAYEVDKERGRPNDEGIKVTAVDTAPALLADGDPAERTDRGLRIVQEYDDGAIPLDISQASRSSGATGVGTPGTGVGEDGDPSPTLGVSKAVPAVATFRKSRRAATSSDDETWVEADHANTLNCFDGGDTRATEVVVQAGPLPMSARVNTGELAPTLMSQASPNRGGSEGPMQLVPPIPYSITPETGGGADLTAREVDCSPTLDCANLERKGDRGVRLATSAAVRRLTPVECERLQGLHPVLEWRIEAMSRDEMAAALLAGGFVTVDAAAGSVWRHRGPGGHALRVPKLVEGSLVHGYREGKFVLDGERRNIRLHRLIWISVNGVPPEGMAVCHRNDVKTDNRIENLYLATPEQNSTDAAATGCYPTGADNHATKLPAGAHQQILTDYGQGDATLRELASKYGISKSRIHQIVSMTPWTAPEGVATSDSARYRQLGNAVCANVAEWLAMRIADYRDGLLTVVGP